MKFRNRYLLTSSPWNTLDFNCFILVSFPLHQHKTKLYNFSYTLYFCDFGQNTLSYLKEEEGTEKNIMMTVVVEIVIRNSKLCTFFKKETQQQEERRCTHKLWSRGKLTSCKSTPSASTENKTLHLHFLHIFFINSSIQQILPGTVSLSIYSTLNKTDKFSIIMELTYLVWEISTK